MGPLVRSTWQNKYLILVKFAKKTSTYYLFYFYILYRLGRRPPQQARRPVSTCRPHPAAPPGCLAAGRRASQPGVPPCCLSSPLLSCDPRPPFLPQPSTLMRTSARNSRATDRPTTQQIGVDGDSDRGEGQEVEEGPGGEISGWPGTASLVCG
jgi:hypothetical protein